MSTITQTEIRAIVAEAQLRRRLLTAAIRVTALGSIHHVDHIVRGNHIRWPFGPAVTPFTFSLLVYPFLLMGCTLWHAGGCGPVVSHADYEAPCNGSQCHPE